MCPPIFPMQLLLLLTALPLLIIAERSDSASSETVDEDIDSAIPPDVSHFAAKPNRLLYSTLPINYFLPAPQPQPQPQRELMYRRSVALPYVYDPPYLGVGYPVGHAFEQTIGPSTTHTVVVSFIGLLILFAIIQNTIAAVKRREPLIESLASREKRDLYATYHFNSMTPEQQDILNDDARVRCIQRTVCLENRKLVGDLGAAGRILAKYLTRGIKKSLKGTTGWDRLVGDAGAAGLRGENCNVLYRDCFIPVFSSNGASVSGEFEKGS